MLIEEARRARDKKIPVKYLGDTYRINYIQHPSSSQLDWLAYIQRLGPHERFFDEISVNVAYLVETRDD